ncbi:hypothetical protein UFOVP587_4 [uncultured Caudovirales phage]|uniref:Uncharacterized protein n=1 Tax=uncultured Caudovirales phage TaxID=2100421 RepID=A0A6J5MXW3_9CAUD|nr:hypothetical protein UFOVP587_4 [uncultured Caudovirales phage]
MDWNVNTVSLLPNTADFRVIAQLFRELAREIERMQQEIAALKKGA